VRACVRACVYVSVVFISQYHKKLRYYFFTISTRTEWKLLAIVEPNHILKHICWMGLIDNENVFCYLQSIHYKCIFTIKIIFVS